MKDIVLSKILVTHDGSRLASVALPYALSMAKAYSAELVLLSIIEPVLEESYIHSGGIVPPVIMTHETATEILLENRKRITHQLEKIKNDFNDSNVTNVSIVVEEGDVQSKIVELSKKLQCDVIIMSTHGRSGLGRVLLGSIAEYVVRHAVCPVLLVRAK